MKPHSLLESENNQATEHCKGPTFWALMILFHLCLQTGQFFLGSFVFLGIPFWTRVTPVHSPTFLLYSMDGSPSFSFWNQLPATHRSATESASHVWGFVSASLYPRTSLSTTAVALRVRGARQTSGAPLNAMKAYLLPASQTLCQTVGTEWG